MSILTKLKNNINFYQVHKILVNTQRNCFKLQLKNLKYQEGILIIEFKENLKIEGSPREMSKEFYNKQSCSVLGMYLIYYNKDNNIKKIILIIFQLYYLMIVFL